MRSFFANTLCAIASLGVTAGIVAFADPAIAGTRDFGVRQTVVQTSDLDLRSAAGIATARRRIHSAAIGVCAADGLSAAVSGCQRTAISNGEQALGLRVASASGIVLAAR